MFAISPPERKITQPGSTVDNFYCKLCDLQCTGRESFDTHTSGSRHCKKYLTKQNDLGFDEFDLHFNEVPFTKRCGNVPPPSAWERYALQVYRSGLVNKFTCKACGANTFQMLKWFEHVYSYEHGEKIRSLQSTMSRALFLNQFGDLAGPNPKLFSQEGGKIMLRNNEEKVTNGGDQNGLEYPFNLNLDSLTKPYNSSGGSSYRSDNHRSSSTPLNSNHLPYENERLSPNAQLVNLSQNRRRRHRQHQHDDDDEDDEDDDDGTDRKRVKAVRIKEFPIQHLYSPEHEHQFNGGHRKKAQWKNEPMAHPLNRAKLDSSDRPRNVRDPRLPQASPANSGGGNNNSFSFKNLLGGGNSSDDVLRQTMREFLADVVKRQPPRTDKAPKDDKLFRSLSVPEQRQLLDIHNLTNDDSVWRCYGAIKFLQALDPQLLTAISRLVDQPSSAPSATNRTAHAPRNSRLN